MLPTLKTTWGAVSKELFLYWDWESHSCALKSGRFLSLQVAVWCVNLPADVVTKVWNETTKGLEWDGLEDPF